MAEENKDSEANGSGGVEEQKKCPPCPPKGLPGWMGTFTDLAILLLTFFVLLLSFCKTETEKYEAALGSIRNAFGGNVLQHGEVIQEGKSPDDAPTMLDSEQPVQPFPIDFLTTEGLLERHEINRESEEVLRDMKNDLYEYELSDNVEVYEMPEGIRVKVKDRIYFKEGSIEPDEVSIAVYDRIVNLLAEQDWTIYVEGHASIGETSTDEQKDAFELSSQRAMAVSRSLARRGVRPDKIVTVFFGDSDTIDSPSNDYEENQRLSRRVEFTIRKLHINRGGHKVRSK